MATWALRILLGIVLLVTGLIAIILVARPELDLGPYRESLSARASEALGREVRFGGDIQLQLGRRIGLRATDVAIANPPWAASDTLFRAAHLAAGLDLGALLGRVVHIDGIELRDADVVLEVSEESGPSWELGGASEPEPEPKPVPESAAKRRQKPGFALIVERVAISDLSISYLESQSATPVLIDVTRLDQRNDGGMLLLDATGSANELPFRIAGRVGTLNALIIARDIDVDLTAGLGDTHLSLKGRLGDPERLEDMTLRLSLLGPSLAELLMAFGIDYQAQGDIDLTLEVSDLEQGFAWQSAGRVGAFNLDSKGSIEKPLELDDVTASITLDGEDLSVLGRLAGIRTLPQQAYRLRGEFLHHQSGLEFRDIVLETGKASARLSGKLPLFPTFDDGSTQLDISIPALGHLLGLEPEQTKALGALHVDADLVTRKNGDEILSAKIGLGRDQIQLEGPVGSYPDFKGTGLEFALSGPDLKTVAALAGLEAPPAGQYRLAGTLNVAADQVLKLVMKDGRFGDIRLGAVGALGRLPELSDADLAVSVSGDSLDATAGALAGTALPAVPFSIDTRLLGDLAAPDIGGIDAKIADATLKVSGRIGLPPKFSGTDAKLAGEIPRIGQLVPDAPADPPADHWSRRGYRFDGRLKRDGDRLVLKDLKVTGPAGEAEIQASVPTSMALAGVKLRLDASIPELSAAVPATEDYAPPALPLKAKMQLAFTESQVDIGGVDVGLGDARLSGKGRLALDVGGKDASFSLEAKGPRLSDLGVIGGVELPDERFAMAVALKQQPKRLDAKDIRIEVGDGRIDGQLSVEQRERPYVDLKLDARKFDFRRLLPAEDEAEVADEPKTAPSSEPDQETQQSERLIPDEVPPLDFLDLIDGRFELTGEDLMYPDPKFVNKVLVRNLGLLATLDNGNLDVRSFTAEGDRGGLSAQGALKRASGDVATDWKIKGEKFKFGLLADGTDLEKLPQHELDATVSAAGKTYRELAASLNGEFNLTGGAGETLNSGLDKLLGSFLDELVSSILPKDEKAQYTRVECTAASIDFVDGVVQASPGFVMRTEKLDISAKGTIDLTTEKIDMHFRNAARKDVGISIAGLVNPYIKIGGTLASPGVSLDAPSALLSGGAAVATGGLSILATTLVDRVATVVNPCEQVIAAAEKKLEQAGETNEVEAVKDEAVKDGIVKDEAVEDGTASGAAVDDNTVIDKTVVDPAGDAGG